jgi:glycosyltransferase involved in cell wall biosynthesis
MITKTLNGMAAARPTVATSAGNAGTGAQAGEDLVVADSTPAFAEAVVHLLQDQETWLKFARQGRHYVVTHYNWEEIIRSFELFLRSIC